VFLKPRAELRTARRFQSANIGIAAARNEIDSRRFERLDGATIPAS
jgi:hypothetical protein